MSYPRILMESQYAPSSTMRIVQRTRGEIVLERRCLDDAMGNPVWDQCAEYGDVFSYPKGSNEQDQVIAEALLCGLRALIDRTDEVELATKAKQPSANQEEK